MDNENLDTLAAEALNPQTPAAPARELPQGGDRSDADDDGRQAEQGPVGEKAPQKPPQTPEERARQAAGRRLREREAARQAGYEAGWAAAKAAEGRERRPAAAETADIPGQLAEIRAIDPEMTDLGAILRSEAGNRFRDYVNRGLNFTEAYTLAARDRLAAIAADRAGNAALARAAGKAHLTATGTRGAGAPAVPSDELAIFRELNPGVSDADIQKYYAADRKRFGG